MARWEYSSYSSAISATIREYVQLLLKFQLDKGCNGATDMDISKNAVQPLRYAGLVLS
ncbi:hypothetical protein [Sulfolobus acidocaldarius]|uniref:hypothetical protein n=1 Tax=Sulfolobus acidocaldarius TaxID=2285 RepID=UPI0012D913A0|nr:hypothetical protein [Sulfolobus acidocaldarius]